MALQDILDAITAEADQRIADARTAHQKRLSHLREESDRRILKKKQDINAQREEKKRQIRMKGEAAVTVRRRNMFLARKRSLLDAVYAHAEEALVALPEKQLRPLLERCLDLIEEVGTIRPAKVHASLLDTLLHNRLHLTVGAPLDVSGGFLFVSDRAERDCTFATIVREQLRPRTETMAVTQLFLPHS